MTQSATTQTPHRACRDAECGHPECRIGELTGSAHGESTGAHSPRRCRRACDHARHREPAADHVGEIFAAFPQLDTGDRALRHTTRAGADRHRDFDEIEAELRALTKRRAGGSSTTAHRGHAPEPGAHDPVQPPGRPLRARRLRRTTPRPDSIRPGAPRPERMGESSSFDPSHVPQRYRQGPLLTPAWSHPPAKTAGGGVHATERLGRGNACPRRAGQPAGRRDRRRAGQTQADRGQPAPLVLDRQALRGRGMVLLDLVQEGNLGLIRASRVRLHEGFKFSTQRDVWIARRSPGRTRISPHHRIPVHMVETMKQCCGSSVRCCRSSGASRRSKNRAQSRPHPRPRA